MNPVPARWLLALLTPVTMVIGAGLIGIYASGSETSDDAGELVASSTPQRLTASPIASAGPATILGSFDDRYDFRSFAERLSAALDSGDVQFFMDNVTFVPIDCTLRGMPPPPDSCKDEPAGASVAGVLLEAWATDHPHFDADEYEEFIREFLTEPTALTSDEYGDAEPKLHAYALFRPQYDVYANSLPFPPVSSVRAIATRIPAATPIGRAVVFFHVVHDGDRWTIAVVGVPAGAQDALLDPSSPAGIEQGSDRILEFWSRWQ